MSSIRVTFIAAIAAAMGLAGCQSTTPLYPNQSGSVNAPVSRAPDNVLEYGYVTNIETLQNTHRGSSGAGILLGAVVGGLLGNQVGGGSGRTAATIAGAVGGAVAGNTVEGRMDNGSQQGQVYGYRITIRVDSGQNRVYDVSSTGDLRTNDRVQVRNGQIARIN
ncbi:glycine zipper 2TM domain-containing protein [Lampropedia puyangensis]|uniref:Glycine zipper 2TM domain-containing protein n=1 Tax=Lampropedia puyangensis TaxID=1330072 RepID=A0A4S8F3W7_9BURK|nr:glycine zipper 2TM domain-containing protein [Lampropedia puyangensis]THU02053.1 glycine zipper 2TM domain-containing protein [Lampropedia puyangensis]